MSIIHIPKGAAPRDDKQAILLAEVHAATALTGERRKGHWINFHWRTLSALLGREYAPIAGSAVEDGYIERNPRYAVGRYSKSLRLTDAYRKPATTPYFLKRTPRSPRSRIRLSANDAIARRLVECFSEVELPEAVRATGWAAYSVAQLRRRDFHATRCQFGRLHTTFTSLPKAIRAQLRHTSGEALVELDLRNAQPTLCALLCLKHYEQSIQKHTNTTHHTHPPTYHPPYAAHLEAQRLLNICERGDFYEHLVELASVAGLSLFDTLPPELRWRNRPLNRRDVKKQFLIAMFSTNEKAARMPLFAVFAGAFPHAAKYMTIAKAGEHQALACACQRLESSLVIDGAAAEIVAAGLPILTVHDAILCRRRDEAFVRAAIERQFLTLGCKPSIQRSLTHG